MRLIDADAVIKAIDDLPDCDNGFSGTYDKARIIGVIEEVPPVPAVPLDWLSMHITPEGMDALEMAWRMEHG